MQSDWKTTVQNVIDSLPAEGFWSVKHLLGGLLDEAEYITASYWQDKSTKHVIEWLEDCKDQSEKRLIFENRWKAIPNMENIASYTKQEVAKIQELIDQLST